MVQPVMGVYQVIYHHAWINAINEHGLYNLERYTLHMENPISESTVIQRGDPQSGVVRMGLCPEERISSGRDMG